MLESIGIKDSPVAMQAGAITTAALAGVILARRKSWFHRALYPVVGGTGMWAAFYYSVPQNRTDLYDKLKSLINRIPKK